MSINRHHDPRMYLRKIWLSQADYEDAEVDFIAVLRESLIRGDQKCLFELHICPDRFVISALVFVPRGSNTICPA